MRNWYEKGKVECENCKWKGDIDDVLEAEHPFQEGTTCFGCPRCKSIDSFAGLCFWPGCYERATCGADGGFWCGEHYGKIIKKGED